MKLETKNIPFEGGELLGIKDENGVVWLGVRKACLDIGMSVGQADRQIKNIKSDIVFGGKCVKFDVLQTEGKRQIKREIECIREDFVTLWFAKISLTPTMQKNNPEAVQKLVNYQLKAAKTLHEAFFKTDEQKETLFSELGITGEIHDINAKIDELKDIILDNYTINSRQALSLLKIARTRVADLLDGVNSPNYKKLSRTYFKRLWINLCDMFGVSTYKDLNPKDFTAAQRFIKNWICNI